MPGFREFGDRPGDATSASFLARVNQELAAARRLGVSPPLTINKGPHGDHFALDRGSIDLRRFLATSELVEGDLVLAKAIGYDPATNTCTIIGEEFLVYSAAFGSRTPSTVMREGDFGLAYFQPDAGRWEFLQSDALNRIDDFFPAIINGHATSGGTYVYSWSEAEFTSTIALATVLSGGRTGTYTPRTWPATELNNTLVADNTVVWMRREFKPDDPAVASLTKTLSGNGAGTHATFSLYIDEATGGTYTITFDGNTSTAIAFDASAATTKSAIQGTATGLTLSSFSGSGTLASPWVFSVTSDANDHIATADSSTLKDESGFRFSGGGTATTGLCGWGAMPAATGSYNIVVKQDSDDCLAYIPVATCTDPADLDGGETT